MQTHFDGVAGAFAYLLFVLLTCPAAAAMGALVRETGRQWALFTAAWCNYVASCAPPSSTNWRPFAAHPSRA